MEKLHLIYDYLEEIVILEGVTTSEVRTFLKEKWEEHEAICDSLGENIENLEAFYKEIESGDEKSLADMLDGLGLCLYSRRVNYVK